MTSLILLIDTVLWLYEVVLIASVVLSWLIAFNIVNSYNRVVSSIGETVYRLTEPVLRPIRSILPNLGPVDLAPLIALIIVHFLRNFIILDLPRWLA